MSTLATLTTIIDELIRTERTFLDGTGTERMWSDLEIELALPRAMAIEEAQSVGEVAGPAEEVAPGVFKPTTKGVGAVSLYERILAITGEEEASDRDTWRSRRPTWRPGRVPGPGPRRRLSGE